jgi:ankyrin repeat protein
VREFSDQSTLATLSQSYLSAQADSSKSGEKTIGASDSAPTSDEAEEVKKIRAIIRDSPDLINAKDQSGNTGLHTVAFAGHLVVSRFLVENGADVNAQNRDGLTPLHIAASGGHKALVELLLDHRASAQLADANGNTPLHAAAREGFRSIVEVLLAHGADVNAKNRTGSTPLHFAAANGFKSVAELLLSHQATVDLATSDARDEQQRNFNGTPLHIAASRDDQAIAELLLANKANPNATNSNGDTPLHISAARGNQKLAELLLANKANVDSINKNGEAPLDLAAGSGRTEVISVLLSHGADINARNSVDQGWKGWTPLIYAVSSSQIPTTDLLLKNRADPNLKTENQGGSWGKGFTPLLIACSISGMADTIAALLDAKADPNLKTDFGMDPARAALNLPVLAERKHVLSLLLDHGAGIESRDDQGKTLLMLAAERRDNEIVELLLARKADVNARTPKSLTALHYMVFSININSGSGTPEVIPDIAKALLEARANPNVQSDEGKTALNYLHGNYPLNTVFPLGTISTKIRDLLLAHGAILDLPRLDTIEVRRPETKFSRVIFRKGTNGWDQLTLFELIGVQYNLLSALPEGETRPLLSIHSGFAPPTSGLDFPDFKRIRIKHPKPDFKTWDERTVDVDAGLATGDCSVDVPLQMGDQVEIPEADHVLNTRWEGLDKPTLETLQRCLTGHITIVVKGQTNNVTLGPDVTLTNTISVSGQTTERIAPRVRQFAPFMIRPALNESRVLLASSDLSHIKLIRTDPSTGQKRELIVDCSYDKPAPSVWLCDGDIIEVPDKQ